MPFSDDGDMLKKLHARMIDTLGGYDEGIGKTDDAGVAAFFERFRTIRARHADELDGTLRAAGLKPQQDGSWMTYVHEGIMKVRGAFGTLDDSVKDDVVNGEKAILDLYHEALETTTDEPTTRTVLMRQTTELRGEIERTGMA